MPLHRTEYCCYSLMICVCALCEQLLTSNGDGAELQWSKAAAAHLKTCSPSSSVGSSMGSSCEHGDTTVRECVVQSFPVMVDVFITVCWKLCQRHWMGCF